MPAQQQPKPFTPGFKLAFENFTRVANTNPKKLAAEHKDLSPENRLKKLKQMFKLVQSIPFKNATAPMFIEKLTTFLTTLNETMEDPKLAQKLDGISKLAGNKPKLKALQELFKDEKIVEACANYWNMHIKSQYRNKMDDTVEVFGANGEDAAQAINHVDSQGNYDPEKKVVRDFMRLLYELFDIVLIQAGYKAVFLPDTKQHGSGMWDPKKGVLFPD